LTTIESRNNYDGEVENLSKVSSVLHIVKFFVFAIARMNEMYKAELRLGIGSGWKHVTESNDVKNNRIERSIYSRLNIDRSKCELDAGVEERCKKIIE
jgi:hypothetical protein